MATDAFKRAIAAANSGQRFPVISLVRDNPELAAQLSKLVPGIDPPIYGNDGNRQPIAPNINNFHTTSERTAQNISDSQTVMELLPDMELAAQILVSSILSPKDMMTVELVYAVSEGFDTLDVCSALLTRAKTFFEKDYKIQPLLPKMLRDMLFETGSYPVAVIPESTIDDVINGSDRIKMESLADTINVNDGSIKSIGILGPFRKEQPNLERKAPGLSMEALKDYAGTVNVDGRVTLEGIINNTGVSDTYLTVTDNPNLLKLPEIHQRIRESRIMGAIGSRAMESFGNRTPAAKVTTQKYNDRQMASMIYKERQFGYQPIAALKTQDQLARRSVGNPLIMHLPSESVIPVYVPGCPEKQVGFFVLIDQDGHPISRAEDIDYYQQLSSRLNSNGSFPSAMLTKVKSQMTGFDLSARDHLDYSARAYGDMVEQDLLARLRNGVYGNGVAIAKQEEVYRIMFSRALARQHTQLLFLPVELMTYFAFRYTTDGIGKSLLDSMKILNSLRAMLTFANVMASLKNSIGRTEVKLKLDADDPNPQKSIELAIHEIIRSRQQYFPLGMNSPTDLVDWLQRSGFEFTYEGHPGLPDVAVDFGEKNSNYVKPDTDLEENLRKRAIMSTGLSPESVDATFQAEFAVSIVTNNLLLSKRVMQTQEQFTPQLSDHMRKVMMNSENLMRDLRDILENNFEKLVVELKLTDFGKELLASTGDDKMQERAQMKKQIIDDFLHQFLYSFEVSLPKPNSVTLENQLKALETYTQALDATLDAWISDKFFTSDMGGDVANQVTVIKEVLKAYYLRQWMTENGVMPELSNLTTLGSDGKPAVNIYDMQAGHIEALTKTLTDFMVRLKPIKAISAQVLQETGTEVGSAPAGGSEDTGEGSEGGDLNLGGEDDFNFDAGGAGGTGEGEAGGEAGQAEETPVEGVGGENPEENKEKSEGEEKPAETPPAE